MIKYLSLILLYFLVISTVISAVVYEKENLEISQISVATYEGENVDFTGETDFNDIIDLSASSLNNWEIENNTLKYSANFISTYFEKPIYFKGVKEESGVYTVNYHLNNPDNLEWEIWIANDGIASQSKDWRLKYDDYGFARTLSIKTPESWDLIYSLTPEYLYQEEINLTGEHVITTVLSHNKNEISIYIDNVLKTTIQRDLEPSYEHYAGIKILEAGELTLTKVTTKVSILPESASFIELFTLITFWTVPEEYFPLVFNLLLIKFPGIILLMGIAFYVRGVH